MKTLPEAINDFTEDASYMDMLVTQAKTKFYKMLDDAKHGKNPNGFPELGKILDTIAVETWRKKG